MPLPLRPSTSMLSTETRKDIHGTRRSPAVGQLQVTITGGEFAWIFTPPALSISATYRCVMAED